MLKYLIKTTETYRIENSLVDLADFQNELYEDAAKQRYTVTGFAYKEKTAKEDEWIQVVVTKAFEQEKCPDLPLKAVTYENYLVQENDIDEQEECDFE